MGGSQEKSLSPVKGQLLKLADKSSEKGRIQPAHSFEEEDCETVIKRGKFVGHGG